MRNIFLALAVVAGLGVGQAFAADSFSLNNEVLLVVKGKVVDLACVLGQGCPPNCGDGKRQLGVLTADDRLYVAAKSNANFAGLTHDLLPLCGQQIIADGLTTTSQGTRLLMIQGLKLHDGDAFAETDRFLKDWAAAHGTTPDSKITEEWFRNDPAIAAAVAKRGKTGLPP